jgi:hypothetical protein
MVQQGNFPHETIFVYILTIDNLSGMRHLNDFFSNMSLPLFLVTFSLEYLNHAVYFKSSLNSYFININNSYADGMNVHIDPHVGIDRSNGYE